MEKDNIKKDSNSKNNLKERFGGNVKSLRISIGENQGDLRWATRNEDDKKYNANIISYYENGKRGPDMEQLKNLSEHLGVTIDELIGSAYSVAQCSSFGRAYRVMDNETGRILLEHEEDASMAACNGYSNGNPWWWK